MKYRRRPLEVEAVQWTAHNLEEVRAICTDVDTADSGWTLLIPIPAARCIPGLPGYLSVHAGQYVVLVKGVCVPMTEAAFKETYEAIP